MAEISPEQLEAMLERAAEVGAQKALHSLGLQDDQAPGDVAELRSLLDQWRDIKRETVKTAARWVTYAILSALALGIGHKYLNGGQ